MVASNIMATASAEQVFPRIDATQQECITDEQAQFFLDNGLLLIRKLLRGEELKRMQDETLPFVERAARERVKDGDYLYKRHEITGKEVPFRVEYIIDKTRAGKALLGHPFILRSVEKLQGRNFIPTWDSMVFKMAGGGASIPWHRDAGMECCGDRPIFNVDFYLDRADMTNCLWGILGSNHWSTEEAMAKVRELNADLESTGKIKTTGAVPIPMEPGDVIFHNILALHGSPPSQSNLRRVVYYEFRAGEIERSKGPHKPEYIPKKQKLLLACLRDRARSPYVRDEKPFRYNPTPEFATPAFDPTEELSTYRYPHDEYWR